MGTSPGHHGTFFRWAPRDRPQAATAKLGPDGALCKRRRRDAQANCHIFLRFKVCSGRCRGTGRNQQGIPTGKIPANMFFLFSCVARAISAQESALSRTCPAARARSKQCVAPAQLPSPAAVHRCGEVDDTGAKYCPDQESNLGCRGHNATS